MVPVHYRTRENDAGGHVLDTHTFVAYPVRVEASRNGPENGVRIPLSVIRVTANP